MNYPIRLCLSSVCLAVALMFFNFPVAQAATPACGTTLKKNTKLDSDMMCPSRAINFSGKKSKNVTLNCAGHSISSMSDRVIDARSTSGITIKNCLISTGHDGGRAIQFTGVKNSKISGNTISTFGNASRGIGLRGGSSANSIVNNTVQIMGSGNGINFQAGSDNNTVKNNEFHTLASYPVNIQSSSNNVLTGNTLLSGDIVISPIGYIYQSNFSLQNGGMAVDSAGNIYAVENNWGSRDGIGKATAFFQVDPLTGQANSVIPLLQGGKNLKFGFSALDILPNGRVLALRGCCTDSPLYEIDPNTGQVTEIALNASPGDLNGLEATSNTAVLATTSQGSLLNIDLVTGDVFWIGNQATGWTGVAIHPTTDKVYTVSRRRDEPSNTAHLYEIDVNTGQIIAEVGNTGITSLSGIDFAPDGTLYGNYGLVVVDITTGVGTTVGWFGPDPLEPLSRKNKLKNNVFQTIDGSVQFTDSITLPSVLRTDISAASVEITANQVMVDSAALPFLDEPARITLYDIAGTFRNLLVDPEDDDSFEPCPPPQCKFVHFDSDVPPPVHGTLVFDVNGFTTYSSEENTDPTLDFVAMTMLAEIKALLGQPGLSKSTKKKLNLAMKAMSKAKKFLQQGNVKKGLIEISKAVANLQKAKSKVPAASTLIDLLVDASKSEAQADIDAAITSGGTVWLIIEAQADMTEAQNKLNEGKPDKAIIFYKNAWIKARKAANPPTSYAVGDRGPAGGIVFHVTDGGLHGLEAAPTDQGTAPWGCYGTNIPGANGTAIGTGAQNTIDIVAGCPGSAIIAAELATNYTLYGFSDWFLPSIDELAKLYKKRKVVGGFVKTDYWSSSENGPSYAWRVLFYQNGLAAPLYKGAPIMVRAIRAF